MMQEWRQKKLAPTSCATSYEGAAEVRTEEAESQESKHYYIDTIFIHPLTGSYQHKSDLDDTSSIQYPDWSSGIEYIHV